LYISQQHLDRYGKECEAFLERIITDGQTWIHHCEPESKQQTVKWKHPQSPSKKKFKPQPSARKVVLTVFFWTQQGPVVELYQEMDTRVISVQYSEMLTDRPAIRSKH
jgi:hypothetical protein